MSQALQSIPLPTTLRALRIGVDDDVHIRRTVHLAAAKIEDLQDQVRRLLIALASAGPNGGGVQRAGRKRAAVRPADNGEAQHCGE